MTRSQKVFIFGTSTGGALTDPKRTSVVNTWLDLGLGVTDADRLEIQVTEQVDFAVTVYFADSSGNYVYLVGGQASDSMAGEDIEPLQLGGGSPIQLRGMQIQASGRCTVVVTAVKD